MRTLGMALTFVVFFNTPSWAQSNDDVQRCSPAQKDPDSTVHFCSVLIESGELSEGSLPIAFNNQGIAYSQEGEYDRAIQDFDEARLNPSYAPAFNNRGSAYADKGDHDHAIQDFNQAIRLNPRDADAFKNRGIAYRRSWEYDRAIRDYGEAIRLNPSDGDVLYKRGLMQYSTGRYALAQRDFLGAVQLQPKNVYDVLWLYLAQTRAGDYTPGKLGRSAANLDLRNWPGEVVDLYLGRAGPDIVLAAAKDPDPKKEKGQLCEAYFFLAERALLNGNRIDAKGLLEQALRTGATGDSQ